MHLFPNTLTRCYCANCFCCVNALTHLFDNTFASSIYASLTGQSSQTHSTYPTTCCIKCIVCVCVGVCECVWVSVSVRERERKREWKACKFVHHSFSECNKEAEHDNNSKDENDDARNRLIFFNILNNFFWKLLNFPKNVVIFIFFFILKLICEFFWFLDYFLKLKLSALYVFFHNFFKTFVHIIPFFIVFNNFL